MKIKDIKQLTGEGHYKIDIPLSFFKEKIDKFQKEYNLQLNPDFQRGHIWTEKQQIAFVEFILRGGKTSSIQLNHPNWMTDFKGDFVCVDGLQRITALIKFINGELPVFNGVYLNNFEDSDSLLRYDITIRINNLKTRMEVLNWYLEMNSGGTPHTKQELNKVVFLLNEEKRKIFL